MSPKRSGGGASARSVFVDSGAWLAFLHRRDQHHRESDRAMRAAIQDRMTLFTTNLVVAEVHRLLLHRVGFAAARTFLDGLDASRHLEIDFATPSEHAEARAWIAKLADHPITYTDAVSFAAMERRRCRLVLGFDRDFLLAGFELYAR